MERKVLKFGYEDTDQKIEVNLYGLIFEINKENIVEKNISILDSRDELKVEEEIRSLIGQDSIERINEQREKDGYKKMTLDVEMAVLTCIYKAYIETTTGDMIDNINASSNDMVMKAQNIGKNYNKNRNRYKRYRRY